MTTLAATLCLMAIQWSFSFTVADSRGVLGGSIEPLFSPVRLPLGSPRNSCLMRTSSSLSQNPLSSQFASFSKLFTVALASDKKEPLQAWGHCSCSCNKFLLKKRWIGIEHLALKLLFSDSWEQRMCVSKCYNYCWTTLATAINDYFKMVTGRVYSTKILKKNFNWMFRFCWMFRTHINAFEGRYFTITVQTVCSAILYVRVCLYKTQAI